MEIIINRYKNSPCDFCLVIINSEFVEVKTKMNQYKDRSIRIYLGYGFGIGLIFGVIGLIVPNHNIGIFTGIGMLSGLMIATVIDYYRKKSNK